MNANTNPTIANLLTATQAAATAAQAAAEAAQAAQAAAQAAATPSDPYEQWGQLRHAAIEAVTRLAEVLATINEGDDHVIEKNNELADIAASVICLMGQ